MMLKRVKSGHYISVSGEITVTESSGLAQNRWVAMNRDSHNIARAETLKRVKWKLDYLLEGVSRPKKDSRWLLRSGAGEERFCVVDSGHSVVCVSSRDRWMWSTSEWAELFICKVIVLNEDADGNFDSDAGKTQCCEACELTVQVDELRAKMRDAKHVCGKEARRDCPTMRYEDVVQWLDFPTDPPRREVLEAVRRADPDQRAMADAFSRARPSEPWEAFLYGVMIERTLALGVR